MIFGGAGSLALLAGLVTLAMIGLPRRSNAKPVTLQAALEALDHGSYADASRLAEELAKQDKPSDADLSGSLFVRGAAAAYQIELSAREESAAGYAVAIGYLKDARNHGFPQGREPEGMYLLGKSLCRSGQNIASRPVLLEALKARAPQRAEIHCLLAETYLADAKPRLAEAMEENRLALAEPKLSPDLRFQALVQRSQIALAMGEVDQCRAALEKIPAGSQDAPEVTLVRGQLVMREARGLKADAKPDRAAAAIQKFQEAIRLFRVSQGNDTLTTRITRKAMYLIGLCFLESGDDRAAMNQFERTRKTFPGTPEALASALEEAELARKLSRQADALAGYRRVLQSLGEMEIYNNPWLPLDMLRKRILAVYQQYLDAHNYTACLELTRLCVPLFARDRSIELEAEAHQAWGRYLFSQAEQAPPDRAESLRRQGRDQLRRTGRCYTELAKVLIINRRYPEELWNSARAYLEGHAFREATLVLQEYLTNEARRRHADALTSLGEAMLAQGQLDDALKALSECSDLHPRDTAAFRARLMASRAQVEKAEYRKAETLLRDNLASEVLTPASMEWRESLFDLGRLLHLEGRYDEAITRLEEAVVRYPDSSRIVESQYLIADSYRQMARAIQDHLPEVLVENTRILRIKQMNQSLEMALTRMRKLRDALSQRQEGGPLAPPERAVLRNCYFAVGFCLFDLGQYEEAIRAFQATINRYQTAPELLEAYAQIANAYRRLSKPVEARAALAQAKAILNRIQSDSALMETTNYNKAQWAELLDRLSSS